jgi:soluble lytic murein transglycosylase
MDSSPHPDTLPTSKARVDGAGQPPLQDSSGAPAQPPGNSVRPRKRPNPLLVGALVLFCLGLVGLSTWWLLSRREAAPAAPDMLPTDSVRLINSETPIPQRLSPLAVKDSPGDMAYAPESQGWAPALREARRAQDEGHYTSAISQYSALVGNAGQTLSHDALWGLASAYADAGLSLQAIRSYSLFTYLRQDPRSARAFFHIGDLYRQDHLGLLAAQAYTEYIKRAGPAADAVRLLRAGLQSDDKQAEAMYKAVIEGNPQDADLRQALVALAAVKSKQGDHAEAARLYDRLASLRKSRPRPALDDSNQGAEVLAAQQVHLAGDTAAARKRLVDYIKSATGDKSGLHSALGDLLSIDNQAVVSGTISPMPAARIAFDAGYYGEAIGYLDVLRASQPGSPERPAAALLTGRAFAASGDYTSAYNWYTSTLQTYPSAPEAPEAARRAGDALREQGSWDAALGAYEQAVEKYPTSPQADLARTNGAVLGYRLEQRDVALGLLSPLVQRPELSPTLKAEAAFWYAKIEKSQANPAWKDPIKQVSALSPGSYLDFRARSLLAGEPDGGPQAPTFTETALLTQTLGVQYDTEAPERQQLLTWAAALHPPTNATPGTKTPSAIQTSTPQSSVLSPQSSLGPDARIAGDPEVQRAVALLSLDYKDEACTAFKALAERLRSEGDASGLAQVVLYLRYHAGPRTAMAAAETLASMDAAGDPLKRPKLLLKTIYPTPYGPLIMQEAAARKLDPLVVYALIRQESQFVPDARSHADARGLTQVIPSTGNGIAEQLGDTTFATSDLYLPYVNVRYGTYYLASNLPQFDRKLLPTLAAYNGGPGNAARWLAGSALIDPDLYSERIDLFETADYLQQVYLNYGFYRLAYGK